VRARLNIETVKAKIAEYKGKVNGDPIDYYADKGIISDKPKEGEKDPRDSISDFTKKGGPEDENPVKETRRQCRRMYRRKMGINGRNWKK